jgi:hypothetical protein
MNWKIIFCDNKMEISFDSSASHAKMHLCAKFWHIIIRYAMNMTKNYALSLSFAFQGRGCVKAQSLASLHG